jgi:hypothetical protein
LGGFDQSRFVRNNVSFVMGADISYDLLVGIQRIESGTTKLLDSPIFASINAAIPNIWLPPLVCQAFETAFGLVWDATAELYLVSSDLDTQLKADNPSVRFTIGPQATGENVVIEMPYGAFSLEAQSPFAPNSSLYFPLKRARNSTQYMLGRAFLQSAYITVNYEYSNFSVSQALYPGSGTSLELVTLPAFGTPSSDNNSSSLSTGAIAGIAVGGAAVIVAIVAIIWFCIRKRRKQREAKTQIHEADGTRRRPDETYEKTHHQLEGEQIHETDGRVVGYEMGEGHKPHVSQQGPVELPVHEAAAWEAESNASTPFVTPMTTPGMMSPGASPFSAQSTSRPDSNRHFSHR